MNICETLTSAFWFWAILSNWDTQKSWARPLQTCWHLLKNCCCFFFFIIIIVMPEIFRHIYLRFSSPFSINKIARFYNWYLRHHKSPHLAWSFKLTNGKIQQLAMVNRGTWVSGLVAVLRMERHWRVHWQKSAKFVCCLHWCCSLVVFGHLPSSQ